MTVRAGVDNAVELHGDCPSADAEALLQHLLSAPGATVDWRLCDSAHAAVVQVLMATGAPLRGPPRGSFLRLLVEPALKAR